MKKSVIILLVLSILPYSFALQQIAGGSWFVPFNGDWKTAKIEFLGDSQYRPSSVTIKRT